MTRKNQAFSPSYLAQKNNKKLKGETLCVHQQLVKNAAKLRGPVAASTLKKLYLAFQQSNFAPARTSLTRRGAETLLSGYPQKWLQVT
jgi:hypothetical protein